MKDHLISLPTDLVYRVFNLGATSLVGSEYQGQKDVMAATWVCPADYDKMSAVIDSTHFSRKLIEQSGKFALMLPGKGIVKEALTLGSVSKNDNPDKLEQSGAKFFYMDNCPIPFVEGCAAYALFDVIPEPHNEKTYDLFIGKCTAVWADKRILDERGHWNFDESTDHLRTLHYVSGGHFFAIGESMDISLD